mmetsp:Transcript_7363/g.10603  ORF Transcript_7363/g.10603 Transcript_7363/m.10603 type:complete len:134 (-) Transcript_7363:160-561(-)
MSRLAAFPVAALVLGAFACCDATFLRASAPNATLAVDAKMGHPTLNFMKVELGPFESAAAACDYCFGSYTKEGIPPAGPVATECVCMAYPEGVEYNMFCATPTSAAGYISEKGGCKCKARDMEHMADTTCEAV